jgi:hypothetical protein
MDAVTICNLALNMVGIPPIVSFSDNNNNAKLCERFYPVLRDKVLRDHTWSFATFSIKLPRLAEKPFDPRFEFSYQLPSDLLRIIELIPDLPFRKVRDMIFANQDVTGDHYMYRRPGSRYIEHGKVKVAGPEPKYHTVKAGETISKIAVKHGVSQGTIFRLNKLSSRSVIRPGQRIRYQ